MQSLRPGITGLAQINGRDHLTVDDKVAFDREYLETHSLFLDAKILLATFVLVVLRRDISH